MFGLTSCFAVASISSLCFGDFMGSGESPASKGESVTAAGGQLVVTTRSTGVFRMRLTVSPDQIRDVLTGKFGTSMATPVVAGNAAIVRQYYRQGWYPTGAAVAQNAFTPSAALLKATLIGGADSLLSLEASEARTARVPLLMQPLTRPILAVVAQESGASPAAIRAVGGFGLVSLLRSLPLPSVSPHKLVVPGLDLVRSCRRP